MYQTANEFDGVKTGTHMGLGNAQRVELESADIFSSVANNIQITVHWSRRVSTNPKCALVER